MAKEKRSYEERIAELQEKQKQLKEQEKKLKAQQSKEERKKRTKHLIEIGSAVYSVLGDSYQEGDVEKLITFLKRQEQRGRFFSSAMGRNQNHNSDTNN
ncbi:MAG: relaxasome subunit MobC [Oscillospiraceae bacterium]|nr:relaxasome subunit MobC [Oscillospiraceae bacterium]